MLLRFIDLLTTAYMAIIFVEVILSWISSENALRDITRSLTEPVLEPIRRILPQSGIDFSPTIAIILLLLIQNVASRYLAGY
jgi:YggT family protein